MEIIETGGLRRIGFERTEDIEIVKVFMGIYGVGKWMTIFLEILLIRMHSLRRCAFYPGKQTAYVWYRAGCRTLDDIRERKGGIKLSQVQEIGLQFYEGRLALGASVLI